MNLYVVFYCDDEGDSPVGIYDSEEEAGRATKILNKRIGISEDDDIDYDDAYYYTDVSYRLNSCGPSLDAIIEEATL